MYGICKCAHNRMGNVDELHCKLIDRFIERLIIYVNVSVSMDITWYNLLIRTLTHSLTHSHLIRSYQGLGPYSATNISMPDHRYDSNKRMLPFAVARIHAEYKAQVQRIALSRLFPILYICTMFNVHSTGLCHVRIHTQTQTQDT